MPTQADYFKYAETAFASYATNLTRGRGVNADAYRVLADMAPAQADRFDSSWQVLSQQDLNDGFSATLFQQVDAFGSSIGQKVLAIRGSESSHWFADYSADIKSVAILGTAAGSPQFNSLKSFYQSLIAQGRLGSTENIVVTGHSLGGFLAQAFTVEHEVVSAAYTYNSPGFSVASGVATNIGTELLKLFGLSGSIPNDRIFNVRALDGLSATAGLGQMVGSVQPIAIEAGSPIHNHSIVTLTDSLSLYGAYAQLDAQLSPSDMDAVFRAASIQTNGSLEAGLDDLRRVFLGAEAVRINPTGIENREAFYANLYSLTASDEFIAQIGEAAIVSLANEAETSLVTQALGDVAYRYSLVELNSFTVTGSTALFDRFNAEGQLSLYDPQYGTGLTHEYLADRAAMLRWKIQDYTADGSKALLGDTAETYKYVDKTLKDLFGNDLTFTVRGRQERSVGNPALIVFGSEGSETLTGSDLSVGDSFYGGGGNDVLDGQGGDDYLEGGTGDDRLVGGAGDDDLNGGPGFDTYVYDEGDGFDAVTDPGGEGRIVYNGRELSGGTKAGEGLFTDPSGVEFLLLDDGEGGQSLLVDGNIYVEDFFPGAFGITLDGELAPDEPPESVSQRFYFDSDLPDDFDPDSDGFTLGSDYFGSGSDDIFFTTGGIDIVARTGNDVAIFDGDGDYANSIDMGAGDDYVDMSASSGGEGTGRIAGGGGNDYIVGSQGSDLIWGDSYFAVWGGRFFARPEQASEFLIDDLFYVQGEEFEFDFYQLPPSGGVLKTVAHVIDDVFGGFFLGPDSVADSDGVLFGGSLEEAVAAVIGPATAFDDYIDAGDGEDTVTGGSGSDDIFGGSGDDVLFGDYGDSVETRSSGAPSYATLELDFGPLAALFGLPGDDRIDGGDGDDSISDADGGNDVLIGGEGDDSIVSREDLWRPADGEGAHNVIHGGAGNDEIFVDNSTGGFDVVDGGDGDDVIELSAFRFTTDADANGIDDGAGPDGRAVIFGGNGDDVLAVDADNAIVDGGAGDDDYTVLGGSISIVDDAGDDTLHLALPDLEQVDAWLDDFPADLSNAPGLEEGIALRSTVVTGEGAGLLVTTQMRVDGLQSAFSELLIENWFRGSANRIEHIETDDLTGTVLSSAQFEAWGGLHYGSGEADELAAFSDYSDRAFGGGGDDLISTGGGADRIFGGSGDDTLLGGAGDDIYYYALGDGNDTVQDASGFDEIRFGPGVSAADVAVSLDETALVLTVGEGRIEVSGSSRSVPGVEQVRFANGIVVAMSGLLPPLPAPASEPQDTPVNPPLPDAGSGEQSGSASAPPPDSGGAGEGASNSGGEEAHPDPVQGSPAGSPIIADDLPPPAPASEIGSTELVPVVTVPAAGFAVIAPLTATDASPNGVLSPSLPSDLSLLFRNDPVTLSFSSPESQESEGARAAADAPLDMQTMLDAVQAFDAAPSSPAPGGQTQSFSTVLRTEGSGGGERVSGPELTSWALTNALLQFHLDHVDGRDNGDGPADFSLVAPAFSGIGGSLTHQGPGLEAFGSRTPALSTFSGLQEGFTRL
jgi:Ca2+-binding RTX toxin-like protein